MNSNDPTPANQSPADKAGPQPARTKDNPIGTDDIGLPSGIQPDEAGKLKDVQPDPGKVEKKP